MLADQWLLTDNESYLLRDRTASGRLGFALCLKFFQNNGYFPKHQKDIPEDALVFLSKNLGVRSELFSEYRFSERSAKLHRTEIRVFLGVTGTFLE